jgi:hypothetical protein
LRELPTCVAVAVVSAGTGFWRVSTKEPDEVADAWRTAVMVTVAADSTKGAVYNPVAEIVPYVALPPVMELTCQRTAVFVVPVTVAVNCVVAPRRVVDAPEMTTEYEGTEEDELPLPQPERTEMGNNRTTTVVSKRQARAIRSIGPPRFGKTQAVRRDKGTCY